MYVCLDVEHGLNRAHKRIIISQGGGTRVYCVLTRVSMCVLSLVARPLFFLLPNVKEKIAVWLSETTVYSDLE